MQFTRLTNITISKWVRLCSNMGSKHMKTLDSSKTSSLNRNSLINGPGLKEFLVAGKNFPAPNKISDSIVDRIPYLNEIDFAGNGRKVHFEVYGCQMNVNDTEVVWSILKDAGYEKADDIKDSDIVLVITCNNNILIKT